MEPSETVRRSPSRWALVPALLLAAVVAAGLVGHVPAAATSTTGIPSAATSAAGESGLVPAPPRELLHRHDLDRGPELPGGWPAVLALAAALALLPRGRHVVHDLTASQPRRTSRRAGARAPPAILRR